MKKIRNYICIILILTLSFFVVGCNKEEAFSYKKTSDKMLKFDSSNLDLNVFLNDFLHRNLRYDEESLGGWGEGMGAKLGQGAFFGKEWEALALGFFDNSSNVIESDRTESVMSWLRGQPMDKFGYVWQGADEFEKPTGQGEMFKQGWPFPNYTWYQGELPGWEFNAEDDSEGWSVNVMDNKIKNGCFEVSAVSEKEVVFSWPQGKKVNTNHTPFIEVDLSFLDTNTFGQGEMSIGDVKIMFKNDKSDTWYSASQRDYCTRPEESFTPLFRKNFYFDMYNHPAWSYGDNAQNITDLKLVITPKDGGTIYSDIKMNYFRMQYDSRQANNASILITGTKAMYEFTHDQEFLKIMLPKVKRATQFYISNLGGASGVISNDFFVGHEIQLDSFGQRIAGNGIGDGYWDMLSLPNTNIYTNIYFYKAIRDAQWILEACENQGITTESQKIVDRNGLSIECDETSSSLETLKSLIETKFQETFWNERTGRFHAGYSEPYKAIIDYGFTTFNLEAIVAGLATKEQAKSIYEWLDGDRIVASQEYQKDGSSAVLSVNEVSTGKDIYLYRFAPRTCTADNASNHYLWTWSPKKFGFQLQNGGAAIFMSYYDIVGRAKYMGIENAYKRLLEIQKWYFEVMGAGGKGADFYLDYYDNLDPDENPWILIPSNILEGSRMGTAGAGLFGLDYVFPESALLYRSAVDIFLGMKVNTSNTLIIEPNLPENLKHYGNENLKYSSCIYDIAVSNKFVQINTIKGKTDGLKITVRFAKPSKDFSVYINGVKTNDYKIVNGKIEITTSFRSGKIEVK